MNEEIYNIVIDITPEWIIDLSERMGLITTSDENSDGLLSVNISVPPSIGKGGAFFVQINQQLAAFFTDISLNAPVQINMQPAGKELLLLHFPLSEDIIYPPFYNTQSPGPVFPNRQIILSNAATVTRIGAANTRLHSLRIIMMKAYAMEHAFTDSGNIDTEKIRLPGTDILYTQMDMDMRTVNILEELTRMEKKYESFCLHLLGETYLLLANFMENWRLQQSPVSRWHTDDKKLIMKTKDYLLEQLEFGFPGIEKLAEMTNMSVSKYKLLFTRINGIAPKKFFIVHQLDLAKEMLLSGNFRVLDVVYRLGYSNPGFFSQQFKKRFGLSPKEIIPIRSTHR